MNEKTKNYGKSIRSKLLNVSKQEVYSTRRF